MCKCTGTGMSRGDSRLKVDATVASDVERYLKIVGNTSTTTPLPSAVEQVLRDAFIQRTDWGKVSRVTTEEGAEPKTTHIYIDRPIAEGDPMGGSRGIKHTDGTEEVTEYIVYHYKEGEDGNE